MRILYFYPENPLLKNQGNNARALALLNYFKSKEVTLDYVGINDSNFNYDDIENLKKNKLINEGYLLKSLSRKKNQLRYFFLYSLPRKIKNEFKDFNRTRFGQEKLFDDILSENQYDFIIISYAYWSSLLKDCKHIKSAKLIIDTHDFLTSQFQNNKEFQLGKYFEKEIEILNKFDKVLVISNEEKFVFSQFIDKEVSIVTHALKENFNDQQTSKKYDIVYVASNNDHNIKSANWFFNNVYPKLDKDLKICVVGRITRHCIDSENIHKIEFIEDLEVIYKDSKIAICPMLTGTGLKIKVVEAMSYGIPIVCNERGVDGLLNKTNNGCLVTNNPDEFAEYIKKLSKDSTFYQEHSNNAKEFFIENHSISNSYSKLDEVFKL